MSIPNIFQLNQLFFNEDFAYEYIFNNEFLYSEMLCVCEYPMIAKFNENVFRCTKRSCRKRISILHKTIFENSKLKINQILYLG